MLADFQIREGIEQGLIGIEPFREDRLQPVSYDFALGAQLLVPKDPHSYLEMSTGDPTANRLREHSTAGSVLNPYDFILASTEEVFTLDPTIVGHVEGKSSLGRIGMMVHVTAGLIDPGFHGQITLEIHNVGPWKIPLSVGMPIGQITFTQVERPKRDYSQTGRYQGQMGPTRSRYSVSG
jgi:dCTP deaminase